MAGLVKSEFMVEGFGDCLGDYAYSGDESLKIDMRIISIIVWDMVFFLFFWLF